MTADTGAVSTTDRQADRPGAETVDPSRLADVVLAIAIQSAAESVFIEPVAEDEDHYVIALQRDGSDLSSTVLDASAATAAIARLAYIANLDLAATHPSSQVIRVRSGQRDGDVVVTLRPGKGLSASLFVRLKSTAPSLPRSGAKLTIDRDTVIGHYRVQERLGEGGMGAVYRVEHVALGRSYALKLLRPQFIERDPGAGERFLLEARAAARIRHPNIVDVFDFGYAPSGQPYFVMELLEGESLTQRVDRGPLPIAEAVSVCRQLAAGLAAAHDRGVVHADVAPSNALLLSGGANHVKLVDFGLAELLGYGVRNANAEFVLGTPSYISPEQLIGLGPTDRSDQYSLGAVLFEMITGQPPFVHKDINEIAKMHIHAPVPVPVSPFGPLPAKLADVMRTCMQKNPSLRFPGMHAVITVLEEIERITERRGWRKWLTS